ncbi:uncharacterized protein LOC127033743 isoform X3 [Gopherus flavomarginatus]|uniref:uncharacterized protein LOC127033743 isoform X3 n=1 Tax=Gopherus flavomarginatus TaxID=286002 RepID=UPI0021CC1A6B|nr:uncharacterized protein LOC127033743 isoform X3 [Gopherus flavomarginatus]
MNMKSRHDADIALALSNIAKAQEKQQRHYAKRKTSKYGEITFEVGDSVLLLNARQRTRKGGVLESKYRGPYKIMSVEGKRVKLQTISGKQLGTMYSIAHLKPVKEPTTLAAESTSEGKTGTEIGVGDTEPETPTEEIREVDGTVSHDSKVENIEVTAIEKEEYIGQDVSNNDTSDADDSFDDMLTEEVEDKQWLLKVKLVMTSKHTERLEAKVRNIKLYGSSFHCLKPRSWISDEVIDAFLNCVVEKADGKVQAISSVVSTVILSGRATQMKVKIALMKKKELLIIDPLCDEIRYERTCLRNWRNFIKRLTSKSSSDWNSKIVQHPRQSDGHSCGPLILKFAETYLQHKDISTVETTQKANTAFRRHIAILLMKESAWRTTAYTATLLTVKKKVRIARWSSVILARGGHIYHALQKEPIKKTSHVRRKSTNARHVHSSLHYQKKKKAIKKTHCLTASCSKHNATQRNIFLCIHQIIINVFDVK